jgi:hypothetical protein
MGDRFDQSGERSGGLNHSLFRGCKGAWSDLFNQSPQGSIRPEEVFNGVFVHSQNLKARVIILQRQEQVLKRRNACFVFCKILLLHRKSARIDKRNEQARILYIVYKDLARLNPLANFVP